ncbi:MAG: hypothetical protein RSG48_03185 [Clostridia bacterium]
MDIKQHLKAEKSLYENIGKEKIEKIVNEVTNVILQNKLDVTPNTLEDILLYIKNKILITKI